MDDRDWQRLARYFAGESTPEDEAEIQRDLETDPDRARVVESLRELWELSATIRPHHRGNARRVWNRVAGRIRARPAKVIPLPGTEAGNKDHVRRRGAKRGWGNPTLRIAAILLIALVPLAWLSVSKLLEPRSEAVAMREIVTEKGQRLRVTLRDGSVIEIGADSRLRVPVRSAAGRREAHLEGMALFEVAHDPRRPFLVHAQGATTRVLGTRFVVRAYGGEESVDVGVVEGSVAVGPSSVGGGAGTALRRGQLGRIARDGLVSVVEDQEELDHLLGWMTGRLVFADEPLSAVLSQLEHWYGVEFQVPESELAAQPLSTVVHGERLEPLLDVICLVLGARYERSGDTITMRMN